MLISGTIIRLTISLSLHHCYKMYNNGIMMYYKSVQAVLIDPFYTLSNIRETCHLSNLYLNGILTLQSQYNDLQFRKKPILLYAFIDKIFIAINTIGSIVPWDLDINIVFVIGSILIDLLLTMQLFHLAINALKIIDSKNDIVDQQWEQKLERFMHPRIHPPFAFIFGMKFGDDFQQDDDDDIDEKSATANNGNTNTSTTTPIYTSKEESEKNNELDEIENINMSKEPLCKLSDIPILCSTLYYLNPINILATSTFPSFQGIQYLLLITAFQQVTSLSIDKDESHQRRLKIIKSTLCLAILTNIELHYIVFLPPLLCCAKNYYSLRMLWCKFKEHINKCN